jgi:DNA-binding protein HU-beta
MDDQEQVQEIHKQELVRQMAEKSGLTQKDAEAALEAIVHTMEDATKRNDPVKLVGFGTWEVRERKARKGLNPRTAEPIEVPQNKVPIFKSGRTLKDYEFTVKKDGE